MARLTLYGMMQYDPTFWNGVTLPDDYDKEALIDEIVRRSGMLYPYHQVPGILKTSVQKWFARNYHNFDMIMQALLAEYNPIENYDRHEDWTRTPNLKNERVESGKEKNETTYDLTDDTKHTGTDTLGKTGTDTNVKTGTEANAHTGTVTTENTVSAFDSSDYEPSTKAVQTNNNTDTTTYNVTDTDTLALTDTRTLNTEDKTETDGTQTTERSFVDRKTTDSESGKESYTAHLHGNIGVTTSQQMIESEISLRQYDVYDDIARRFEKEFIVQVY